MDRSTAAEPSGRDELESTPFLAPDPLDDEAAAAESDEGPRIPQPKTAQPLKWSLVASAVTVALAIITIGLSIAATVMPIYPWPISDSIAAVRVVAIVAVIWAAINIFLLKTRKRSLPLLLSIIIHVAVVFFALKAAIRALVYLVNRYNSCYRNDWRCRQYTFDLAIILWFYFAFALLFGLHHALLLVLGLVSAYKSRSQLGSDLFGWVLPAGELSVQLTVRLNRQENRANNSATEGELIGDIA